VRTQIRQGEDRRNAGRRRWWTRRLRCAKATNTFVARVQELGIPDVDSAARISRELAGFAEGLDANVVGIEQTVNGSFYSEATATSTFDVSIAFMGHLLDATLGRLLNADPSGDLAADYADTPSCQALSRSPG
jgi:hypothetical protein